MPDRAARAIGLALEDLAADELLFVDYAASLQSDLGVYKSLVSLALQRIHELTLTAQRQQDTIVRLHRIIRDSVVPGEQTRRSA